MSIKLYNIGQLVSYNTIKNNMELLEGVEILIKNGIIEDIGNSLNAADMSIDCNNMLVSPGFVDPHTHPVFYRNRCEEFIMRTGGETYEQIAAKGGGIKKSVKDLRNTNEEELLNLVKNRMDRFLAFGTTTVECKSGYGLDIESELKSLKVIHDVNQIHDIDMVATFMGAHGFPEEFNNERDKYVDLICDEMIPEVSKQGVAVFNDVFCEKNYFNLKQAERILEVGKEYGLYPRLHADEFHDLGGAKLAANVNCISADHLMEISDEGVFELSKNKVIATLLPGTTFFLGKSKYAPFNKLKDAGVDVALATDYNSGSCSIQSMPFIISLACIYFNMSVLDAFKATTYISARTLMLEDKIGSIEKGKNADIIIWNVDNINEIPYRVDSPPIQKVLKNGKPVITA